MALKMYQNNETPRSKIANTIGIAAGKGGVGKSTVTVQLAHALSQLGFTVGILDADLYGPSLKKMLNDEVPPSQNQHLLNPAICSGIKVISMAYFRKEDDAVVVRAPIANGIINQFIDNVNWGPLDFLLIDFPPGTGDIQLTLAQKAHLDAAIMITTPQEVAAIDVKRAMHLFKQVNIPILGVIENMSYYYHEKTDEKLYIFGRGGGASLAKEWDCPLLGEVPIDPSLSLSCDKGNPKLTNSLDVFLKLANGVISELECLKNEKLDTLSSFELVWKEMK